MNKKKVLFIILSIIIITIILYVLLCSLSIRSKMNRYLTDRGDTASEIESVKVKHSFINLLLSYDEWSIQVRYYDEPDVAYFYRYKNNEIVFGGISGGTKDKDLYSHSENIDENIVGGYTEQRDLTSEDLKIFSEAMEEFAGVTYEPLKVSTQVVAGKNYKFYCKAIVVYPNAEPHYAYVYIFKPLGDEKPVITEIIKEE